MTEIYYVEETKLAIVFLYIADLLNKSLRAFFNNDNYLLG